MLQKLNGQAQSRNIHDALIIFCGEQKGNVETKLDAKIHNSNTHGIEWLTRTHKNIVTGESHSSLRKQRKPFKWSVHIRTKKSFFSEHSGSETGACQIVNTVTIIPPLTILSVSASSTFIYITQLCTFYHKLRVADGLWNMNNKDHYHNELGLCSKRRILLYRLGSE